MNFNKILKTKEIIKINDRTIIATTDKQLNTTDEYREFFLRNNSVLKLLNITQNNNRISVTKSKINNGLKNISFDLNNINKSAYCN